jgi:hypothetical protein
VLCVECSPISIGIRLNTVLQAVSAGRELESGVSLVIVRILDAFNAQAQKDTEETAHSARSLLRLLMRCPAWPATSALASYVASVEPVSAVTLPNSTASLRPVAVSLAATVLQARLLGLRPESARLQQLIGVGNEALCDVRF